MIFVTMEVGRFKSSGRSAILTLQKNNHQPIRKNVLQKTEKSQISIYFSVFSDILKIHQLIEMKRQILFVRFFYCARMPQH